MSKRHHLRTEHLDGIRSTPVDDYVKGIFSFYKTTTKRESEFFNLLKQEMMKRFQRSSVLVTGGFHKEGVVKRLKKAGVSYLVVLPKIEQLSDHERYLELMRESGNLFNIPSRNTIGVAIANYGTTKRWHIML